MTTPITPAVGHEYKNNDTVWTWTGSTWAVKTPAVGEVRYMSTAPSNNGWKSATGTVSGGSYTGAISRIGQSYPYVWTGQVNNLPTGSVTISGTIVVGNTLTSSVSLADADGLGTFSYQWRRNGQNISGATSQTYTLVQADTNSYVSLNVRYTDGRGNVESVNSQALGPIELNWQAPIVITTGGTYTGNWRSTDPSIPAVTISTSSPVTLTNFRTEAAGNHILFNVGGARATITNGIAKGLRPTVSGLTAGRFIADAAGIVSLIVENNTVRNTSGIYLDGGGSSSLQTLRIRYNKVYDIDGRKSAGALGYLNDKEPRQWVQVNGYRDIGAADIQWNYVENRPGNSAVEDNINVYLSSGVSNRRFNISDNCIYGAYPLNPLTDSYSGGGIITDGDASSPSNSTNYVTIQRNTVVGTTNYGIAIAAGLNNIVNNNRVISSGKNPATGQLMASANVGVYMWDIYGDAAASAYGNNTGSNNYVGWVMNTGVFNHFWMPNATSWTGTTSPSILPDLQVELAEIQAWINRVRSASLTIGSVLPDYYLVQGQYRY